MGDANSGAQGAAKGAAAGAMLGPWGALAGGVIGGLMGFMGGGAAAAAQKRAAMEQLRRDDRRRAETLGQGHAAAGASGIEVAGSSMSRYLTSMSDEFRREHDWQLRQAEQGKALADQANRFELASSLGGSLFRFGQSQGWGSQA